MALHAGQLSLRLDCGPIKNGVCVMHGLKNMLGPGWRNWIQTYEYWRLHGQGLKPIHPVGDANVAAGLIVRV
jgi:hypothetical protein